MEGLKKVGLFFLISLAIMAVLFALALLVDVSLLDFHRWLLEGKLGIGYQGILYQLAQNTLMILEAILLMAVLTLAIFCRVKPRLFISYKGEKYPIAQQLAQAFKRDFRILLHEMIENPEHDQVVGSIRGKIRKADVAITIPHAEKISFVDAEVLSLVVMGVPVAYLTYQDKQDQLSTAFLGYGVFPVENIFPEAEAPKLRPLSVYLSFAGRSLRAYLHVMRWELRRFFQIAPLIAFAALMVLSALAKLQSGIIEQFSAGKPIHLDFASQEFAEFDPFTAVTLLFIVGYALYLATQNIYLIFIARQEIITGKASHSIFKKEFGTDPHFGVIFQGLTENTNRPQHEKKKKDETKGN